MLRVLTLNINYYEEKHGSWGNRKALIQESIRKLQPDIVAVQAVRLDPAVEKEDQARQLAEGLEGFQHHFFQPASSEGNTAEGSAIISRLPFAHRDYLQLTRLEDVDDPNERVLMLARFDLPTGPFHLFNAHFSWVPEQTSRNLDEALPYINTFPTPALLVGDFNIPAGADLLDRLRSAGWVDLWAALKPGMEGFTYEAGSESIRIDYAWANAALAPQAEAIGIVENSREVEGVRLSNHLGLIVTLSLASEEELPQ